MTAHETMTADHALGDGPFRHDLVRSEDLEAAYGVTRFQAHRFLVGIGAVSLPRYTGGLERTGVPPIRIYAVRNATDWESAGAKVRTLAYLERGAAA